jgi:hypothetical protein
MNSAITLLLLSENMLQSQHRIYKFIGVYKQATQKYNCLNAQEAKTFGSLNFTVDFHV